MEHKQDAKKTEFQDKGIFTASDPVGFGNCPVCKGSSWELIDQDASEVYGAGATVKAARPCTYCNGGHARKVSDALIASGIPEGRRLNSFSWRVYDVDLTSEKKTIDMFVDNFPDMEHDHHGLFITSRMRGSGKTLLATAVGGELIHRYEASVKFVSVSNLIELSKRKRDDGGDPLESLMTCRVLILDDIGQQRTGRDWLSDILFRIIDQRCRDRKTIITTSNAIIKDLDLDDRLVDRLYDATLTVKLPEVCVRAMFAERRKRELLKKFGIE